MSTTIEFLAYVMNHLKIDNLTQDHLVGPVFNLLKRTCKSHVKLEYNIEECYKALTDRLDWNNPEGNEYSFNLSMPLPLIIERGRQVVLVNYFFNNYLEYLRRGSSSKKYMTSTTKTKAAKYDIPGIEDMVPSLWSLVKTYFHPQASGRPSTGNQKLPEVAQYHQARDIQFSDGTLTSIRTILHGIALNLRMDYLPNKTWSSLDRKRSCIMIKAIDQLQLERRLMRSLEKFVGGRDYGGDLRLLEWTI
ncbi:hypothetical protein Tco_1305979 [Tanacetum coccineum]